MEERRAIVADNLIRLRIAAGLTQAELGERLNYSDKSVSKWERGDAVPDVFVMKQIADIYGVTVDYLLESHEGASTPAIPVSDATGYSTATITWVSILGIWTLALLAFVILWISGRLVWHIFIYAVPLSLVTLLVLHSIWRQGKRNQYIIAALVFSLILAVYLTLQPVLDVNPGQLFLVVIPAELVVFLSFRIRKTHKTPDSPEQRETEPEE